MRVVGKHSHLGGHEYLLMHRKRVCSEIAVAIKGGSTKELGGTLAPFEPAHRGVRPWPAEIILQVGERLSQRRWQQMPGPTSCAQPNAAPAQIELVKERVAITLHVATLPSVGCELFARDAALFASDLVDVGIHILPAMEWLGELSTGIAYYEGELYNLIRQGRGVPAVPLVVMGLAP